MAVGRRNCNPHALNRTDGHIFERCHGAERKARNGRPVEERGMKFLVLLLAWGLMLAGASMPAAAAPVDSHGNAGSSVQLPSSRPVPRREADRPARLGAGETEGSRMSVDERRQLRRDIENAGRDIYRTAAQRRGSSRRSGSR